MDAADLAREVVAYNQLRDRPSPLVLVVYSRMWRGQLGVRNRAVTMRITSPIENGQLMLRVSFPPLGANGHGLDDQGGRAVLEYDAVNNLEGVASCIEGYMTHSGNYDMILFVLLENGDLGPNPLGKWHLDQVGDGGHCRTATRIQILQQILRSLLVR